MIIFFFSYGVGHQKNSIHLLLLRPTWQILKPTVAPLVKRFSQPWFSMWRSYLHQIFPGEQRQANVFHQVGQVFLSDVLVVVHPGDHRLKHLHRRGTQAKVRCVYLLVKATWQDEPMYLLLGGDGELVAGDQAGHLLHAQVEKLLAPDHLREVLL